MLSVCSQDGFTFTDECFGSGPLCLRPTLILYSFRVSPKLAERERGFTAATQFYAFPEPHWARLRTTNSLERLHTEIKRRIRSAGAFPDRASALRLITAVALRTTAVWSERRYLDLSLLEPKEVAKAA